MCVYECTASLQPHPHSSGLSGASWDLEHHYCVHAHVGYFIYFVGRYTASCFFLKGLLVCWESESDSCGSLEWRCRLRYNGIFTALEVTTWIGENGEAVQRIGERGKGYAVETVNGQTPFNQHHCHHQHHPVLS